MKQLTIRGVKDELHTALKVEAARRGLSVNKAVLALLQEKVGLSNGFQGKQPVFDDLDYLAGTWTEEEAAEFQNELTAQRSIDAEMWS